MILQYMESNKEHGYIQADRIHFHRIWTGDILTKYGSQDKPVEDCVDVNIHDKTLWVKKSDFPKIIEEQNEIINEDFKSPRWICDSGDMFLFPAVGLVTLQDWNQEPKHMVVSRAAYLLNNQGKTISSII